MGRAGDTTAEGKGETARLGKFGLNTALISTVGVDALNEAWL
jgi:hypothetical protein